MKKIVLYPRLLEMDVSKTVIATPTTVTLDWADLSTTSSDIDVNPDSMSTTAAKVDTGDGTSWFKIDHSTVTGDYTLTITATSDNITGASRRADIEVTDDDDSSIKATIHLTQITKPT